MEKLITHNGNALRFLMTEDIYVLKEEPMPVTLKTIPEEIKPEPVPETQKEEVQSFGFSYLGENNRYFLVIIDDKTHPSLNTIHKDMLMKIMGAKGLEMRDLAILNLAKYPEANFNQLKDFFSCNRITLFGIDPQRIALPVMAANKPGKHNGVNVLATFSLDEMSSDTNKKREFWSIMKDF